jgi:broad specificity phosphatase PhoE
MKLILVRHGETEWNKQRRIQGCRSDTRLSQKGLGQADRVAAALQRERMDAIYSSPLKRASETAQIIAEACKLPFQVVNDLREIDAGDLDGLFERELTGTYETAWRELRQGNASTPLPGGESLQDLQKRTSWAIDRMLERHIDGTVLVVAHLLANLVIVCEALGIDLGQIGRLRQAPASITVLEMTTQGNSLLLFNDTCHLGQQ